MAVFVALSLTGLDRFPVAIQDEPWIVAPALKLATQGVYGSDLFLGYYGMGQHDYQSVPLYPLVVASAFKTLGIGLVQARLVSVIFGFLTLPLVYLVGRKLIGAMGAAAAVVLLVFWRVTDFGPVFGSGIPLVDLSREARYDIAVPPLILLALGLFLTGMDRGSGRRVAISGFFIGLAALTEFYGAFWLPVLGLLILFWSPGSTLARHRSSTDVTSGRERLHGDRAHDLRLRFPFTWHRWRTEVTSGRERPHGDRDHDLHLRAPTGGRARYLCLLLAGFAVALMPWVIYVAMHLVDYRGQMRFYEPRFRFLDPGFYLTNLRDEYLRYPLDLVRGGLPQAGGTLFVVGLPLALIALAWRAHRPGSMGESAIALGFLLPASLFALVDSEKMFNHVLVLFPFAALALGWGCAQLWSVFARHPRWRWTCRIALASVLGAVLLDGMAGIDNQRRLVAATTPYPQLEAQLNHLIPPGAVVLGSAEFQLGLRSHPYRSLLLPFFLSDPQTSPRPMSFEAALERVAPDVILIERPVAEYLDAIAKPGSSGHEVYVGLKEYLRRHHGRLIGQAVAAECFYSPVMVYGVSR
jgi:4-amino-4-deoxy-L-arabinose transferase-like glycosyltransferase